MATIDKWKGLRNNIAARAMAEGEMDVAQNVDIDDAQRLRSRQGYTETVANAAHSIWSNGTMCLFVQSGVLKRLTTAEGVVTVATLTNNNRMAYDSVAGTVYCTNGTDCLRITPDAVTNWGVRMPIGQPMATQSAGNLPPGRYQYAITYARADGHESGTPLPGVIELTTTGGIAFSSIESSTYDSGCGIILYLSSPNGEVLYRAAVLPDGTTSYDYREDATDLTVPLSTMFAYAAPTGQIVRIYNSVAYVASGNVLYYSDPYHLELFRLAHSFMQFDGYITMVAAVDDGLYIGTETNTYFAQGDRPDKMKLTAVFPYGVMAGTDVLLAKSSLAKEDADEAGSDDGVVAMWLSSRGVCVGAEGGAAKNLSEAVFAIPTGERGAAVVRQVRGYTQYLASLQGTGVTGNSYS